MKKIIKTIKKILAFIALLLLFAILLCTFYYLFLQFKSGVDVVFMMTITGILIILNGLAIIGASINSDGLLGIEDLIEIDGKVMSKNKAISLGLITKEDLDAGEE